uniref:Uncharacterized protein n=1 Tax=Anopheles funestus TaxID=62324 RepID=A0A182S2C7_ANOFN
MGNDETAQRICQPNADAKPLEAAHEPTSLDRRYPVAHDGVHGRPGKPTSEALHRSQQYHGTVMQIRSVRYEQTASCREELGPSEHILGAKVLCGHTTNYLRQYVAPVEG